MNKYFKIINFIFLTLITINLGFSAIEEFEFKLEFDHDFDDNDYAIECEIKYDSRDTTFDFDKDSTGNNLEYSKNFLYELEVDCNKDVDEIYLYVYDENEDRIDKIEIEEDDKLEYFLDLVDKSEDWFEIEITDRFKKDNDCSLNVDGDIYNYEFNDDTSSKRLTIQKNYNKNVKIFCDEEISEIEFTSFDSNENEMFTKKLEDTRVITFDKQVLFETNILEVELNYDFETNSELECDLTKNGESQKFEFKKSDLLQIEEKVGTEFKLSCNDKIKEIKIKILDDKNKKLIEKTFTGKRIINYDLYLQNYLFDLKIETKAKQTTYCTQLLDEDTKLLEDYTIDLKQTNYRIKGSFDKIIDFTCTQKLDKVTLNIYPNDLTKTFDENSKNLLFSKTFGKDSTIDYTLDKSKLNKIKIETENPKQEIKEETLTNVSSDNGLEITDSLISNKLNNELSEGNEDIKLNSESENISEDKAKKPVEIEIYIIYTCLGIMFLLILILIIKKLL